jgi:hypothetical protein
MTTPREPDEILAAWLDEGPIRIPDQTRRAIVVALPTTTQRRRGIVAPWRTPLTSYARLAVAALATIAVIGGAIYFLGPRQSVGGTPGTPSPVPTAWTSFTSGRFAYSIDHPSDWIVTAATGDWTNHQLPHPRGHDQDRFASAPDGGSFVQASSDPLGPGQVPAERIAQIDFANAGAGNPAGACTNSDRQTFLLDGVEARREELTCQGEHWLEVVVVHDARIYLINLFAPSALDETDRATFDRFLASFRFGG